MDYIAELSTVGAIDKMIAHHQEEVERHLREIEHWKDKRAELNLVMISSGGNGIPQRYIEARGENQREMAKKILDEKFIPPDFRKLFSFKKRLLRRPVLDLDALEPFSGRYIELSARDLRVDYPDLYTACVRMSEDDAHLAKLRAEGWAPCSPLDVLWFLEKEYTEKGTDRKPGRAFPGVVFNGKVVKIGEFLSVKKEVDHRYLTGYIPEIEQDFSKQGTLFVLRKV